MIGQAFRYVFSNPKWGMSLLLASVCMLIPIIGPIVLLGFGTEVLRLLVTGQRGPCPEFTFDEFMKHLTKGLMPFLVQLVVSVVLMVISFGVTLPVVLVVILVLANSSAKDYVPCCLFFTSFLVSVALSLIAWVFTTPILVRSMLTLDFKASFDWAFIKDFARRVWGPTILKNLVVALVAVALALVGEAACCIGIYPAIVIINVVYWYMLADLYEVYLQCGGMPIPLKEPPGSVQYGERGPAFEVEPKA